MECFAIAAGKLASSTGYVTVAHNEDNLGELVMRHHYITPDRSEYFFEEGAARIPRADGGFGFFWTETLRPAPGESYGDAFVNEKGVAVVSNSCGKSKENAPDLTEGGIGWGLRRIVAERASNATEAVELASELVMKYGYRGAGRSYVFADSADAWVFQVVAGKTFAARRVPDDHVMTNSNHFTIRCIDFNDERNFRASPGIVGYAIKRGWYEPARRGDWSDFDFAETFQAVESIMKPSNVARHLSGFYEACGVTVELPDKSSRIPFSVKPSALLSMSSMKRALSCHCERAVDEEEFSRDGIHACGCGDDQVFLRICNSGTMESLIIDLRDNPGSTVVWSCFGNPCILPMIPWHVGSKRIPAEFTSGEPHDAQRRHFTSTSEYVASCPAKAWTESRAAVAFCDADYPKRSAIVKELSEEAERQAVCAASEFDASSRMNQDEYFKWDAETSAKMLKELARLSCDLSGY
jgi:dipeptidase